MQHTKNKGVEILESLPGQEALLESAAIDFLVHIHKLFNDRRLELLERRKERLERIQAGEILGLLKETAFVREGRWQVAKAPKALEKRQVEITGPTDRKMIINAMNSGADVFMADFEDANVPMWKNLVEGQLNLQEAVRGTISYVSPEGRSYALEEKRAVLMLRPRGWHLNERHVLVDGAPMSGSLFDFGLFFFHNAKELIKRGAGPYFYLPKMENHLEARLWHDVLAESEKVLGLKNEIRATVLIETILAAFEMDEILYELKEYSAGLNAGRWDYIFSILKTFSTDNNVVFPDRSQITMTVPFMRAYTDLLVNTCHKRGAYAIGGMAAFIPNKKDPFATEQALKKVEEDKIREARDGFDGTWVAHPGLVAIAKKAFQSVEKQEKEKINVEARDLLSFTIPGGTITEEGLRLNISVTLQYLQAWLKGSGAVAINNLMEDTATAEISRGEIWKWMHAGSRLEDGRLINRGLVEEMIQKENVSAEAVRFLRTLIFADHFIDFLTLQER